MRRVIAGLCLSCLIVFAAQARPVPGSFADLVEDLSPAVVNISTTQKVKSAPFQFHFEGMPGGELDPFKEFFERFGERFNQQQTERDVTSLGSGFVIDPSGYIVTNHHVVAEADEVTVTFLDETQYEANIIGRDPKTDLALLKIEAEDLPFVTFGDSDDARVGDWVIAIGNPFGLGGSVSAGIVSARSRNINAGPFDDFIQTDAAINRGNSGGPLFNIEGKVIGVNSAIFSPSGGNVGIGFSIPSALAEPVLKQLREYGRTHRGWLGVKIQHVTDELAESLGMKQAQGALVLELTDGSPAEEAGVKPGDVIISFDGRPVEEMRQLPRMVAETKVGTTVAISVWRDEDEKRLRVTLGEMDEEEGQTLAESTPDAPADEEVDSSEWMGAKLATLTPALRDQLRLGDAATGVVVLQVAAGSPAFEARLQRGDVIVQANQRDVQTPSELSEAISRARRDGKSHALLRVNRRGSLSFMTIATKQE